MKLIERYKISMRLNQLVSEFQRIVFDFRNSDIDRNEFVKKLKKIYISTIKEMKKSKGGS